MLLPDTQPTITPSLIPAGLYRHYKGQLYQVLHCARHSETREWMVVYQCLYGDYSYWIRPLGMFSEQVTLENGQQVPRFQYQSDNDLTACQQ